MLRQQPHTSELPTILQKLLPEFSTVTMRSWRPAFPNRETRETGLRRARFLVRRGKAHLFYDGAVAWIRMQKIEIWIALQEHQVRRPFPVTLFQIADRLFFTSEHRVRIREIAG